MAENSVKIAVEAQLTELEKFRTDLTAAARAGLKEGFLDELKVGMESIRTFLSAGDFVTASKLAIKWGRSAAAEIARLDPLLRRTNAELENLQARRDELAGKQARLSTKIAPYVRTDKGQYRYDTDYARAIFQSRVDDINTALDKQHLSKIDNWTSPYGLAQSLNKALKTDGLTKVLQDKIIKLIQDLGYTPTEKGRVSLSGKVDEEFNKANEEYQAELKKTTEELAKLDAQIESLNKKLAATPPDAKNPGTSQLTADKTTGEGIASINESTAAIVQAREAEEKATAKALEEAKKKKAADEDAADAQTDLSKAVNVSSGALNNQAGVVSKAVTTFFGYQMIVRQLRKLWNEAIRTIREMDKELTNQAIVTNLSREETWGLVTTYQKLANQAGVTQTEIAKVTTEYLRQGETLQNALILTQAATAAAKVAGISSSDSVQYLTTAIHGFKLEAEDALAVSDKFAALAAQAATNYEDLAIALSKVASQAALAGMSMDYTLALLTTGLDVTQEAPESIGTALKTVIARMREISDYGKTLEDDLSINQVQNALDVVGIQLTDVTGELRSSQDVLDELGHKWQDLSKNQQASIAKALAGTRQQSRLVAILDNYNKVIEQQDVAMNSIGATTAQQVEYLEGMEAATNRLQNAYQTFIETITSSEFFINGMNFITSLIEKVTTFLSTPAGKTAFVSGIIAALLKSEQLINKLVSAFRNLVDSLNSTAKIQQTVIKQQQEMLRNQQLMIGQNPDKPTSGLHFIKRIRNMNKWSRDINERAIESGFRSGSTRDLDKQLKTLRQTVGNITHNITDTNKSLSATDAERLLAEKKAAEDQIAALEQLKKQRQVLNSSSLSYAEKELYFQRQGFITQQNENIKIIQARIDELQEIAKGKDAEAKKAQEAIKGLEAEKQKALAAKKGAEDANGRTEQIAMNDFSQTKLGKGVSIAQGITQIIAGVSMLWGLVQQKISEWQNYPAELAQQSIQEVTKIQAKIYSNTQLMTNLKKLSTQFEKLSNTAVHTADSLAELKDVREQLLNELGIDAKDAQGISNETLLQRVESKNLELEEENKKYIEDIGKTLTGASAGAFDFGNVLATTAAFAGAGAAIGGGAGAIVGSIATPIGTAAGGAIGGAIGGVVGGIAGLATGLAQEIQRAKDREDSIRKIQEQLKTEEGVEQWHYYLKATFKDLKNVTSEFNGEIKSVYAQIIDSLSGEEMEEILEKNGWSAEEFTKRLTDALVESGKEIQTINSQYSSYADRIAAAKSAYAKILAAGDKATADAFKSLNISYFNLDEMLGQASKYLDEFRLRLSDVNSFLTILKNGYSEDEAKVIAQQLLAAYANGEDVYNVRDQAGNVVLDNRDIRDAFAAVFSRGQDQQSVAEFETQAYSKVNDVRENQIKWGSMTRAEQERFIAEHSDFFSIPGARQAFLNGEDITPYLRIYEAKLQSTFQDYVSDALAGVNISRQGARNDLAAQGYQINDEGQLFGPDGQLIDEESLQQLPRDVRDLVTAFRQLNLEMQELQDSGKRAEGLFDLQLQTVVDKQHEQVEKLKEMYQAEEQALVDSLNKRKEAYQKYFDSLASQEAAADYAQSRDQLIESISRLSGGTDATSRNKVADLRKQLVQLEKEEAKRQTEEARQAVLENIDNQVAAIEQKFDALLNNNQQLLASMDENTEAQYLNYLATLGLTGEELQLRTQELGDLLRGIWTKEGRQNFGTTTVNATPVPQSPTTEQDPQSVMNLSIGNQTEKVTLKQSDMQALLKQMFAWLNDHAGTHFIV